MENKNDRFVRIAERRVNKIIDNFRLLSQCSNTSVYNFDEEQLNKIWKHIDKSYRDCKASFNDKVKKKKFRL